MRIDPTITYLQVRYGYPNHFELISKVRKEFGEEVLQHLEVIRGKRQGHVCRFADCPIHHGRKAG